MKSIYLLKNIETGRFATEVSEGYILHTDEPIWALYYSTEAEAKSDLHRKNHKKAKEYQVVKASCTIEVLE